MASRGAASRRALSTCCVCASTAPHTAARLPPRAGRSRRCCCSCVPVPAGSEGTSAHITSGPSRAVGGSCALVSRLSRRPSRARSAEVLTADRRPGAAPQVMAALALRSCSLTVGLPQAGALWPHGLVGPVHATSSVTLGRCSATGRAQPCTQGAQGSHTCHIRHFQALPTR